MEDKLNPEKILEEYEKLNQGSPRVVTSPEIKIFNDGIDALESTEHILETIFHFIRQHHEMISALTLDQWLTLKNHFNRLYESISFLVLVLEIAKNIPLLLIKEFTLFVSHIIHKKIDEPVTPNDFIRYKQEDIFYGKAEEMISKYPGIKEKAMALYKKQLDERLLLVHQYMTGMLRIRLETQSDLTGISAPYNEASLDSDKFREDLEESQKLELKNGMVNMAHSAYDFIRRVKVFLQYAYATEKENFTQSTGASALAQRVSFYVKTDAGKAFEYLEQAKSALFLQRLSFRTGFPGHLEDERIKLILEKEQNLKKELENIFVAEQVADFKMLEELSSKRKELDEIYLELSRYPHPAIKDYIDLRRGLSIEYDDLQKILSI
jgi:hypothetical protein